MTMDPVLLIGRYEGYDRDLFLAVTDDVRTWSPDLSQVSSPFVALIALDATPVGEDALSALATRLVGAGCRYALAWGAHAGSIYIAFFDESKERDRAGLNRRDDYLMVDDVGDEPLVNALWHAPSQTMIAQRPNSSAPAIQACAEELPLANDSFDAALAVNTVQHWAELRVGLRELRRVARRRIVIFLRDPRSAEPFWLVEDYLPALDPSERMSAIIETIEDELRPTRIVPVPLPRDCVDGVFSGYWGRPEMYLEADIRRNISNFALTEEDDLREGLARLQADLESGAWDRRYGHLRSLPELDLGHRLLIAELES